MNLSYLSETNGIGGILKERPEDFIVEEIMGNGNIAELNKEIAKEAGSGKFTQFILQKKDWSTADAIRAIAKRLRMSHTRFNFAGTKDKKAITTQLVSVFGVAPEKVLAVDIKDIHINGAWNADEKVRLGDLIGNQFKIKIKNADADEAENKKTVKKIYSELGEKFPNYFGEQRFGTTRKNTHIIGEKIIKEDFEGAVMDYLTNTEGEENEQARLAREELKANGDFATALKNFPKHLRMERMMLTHLEKNNSDFISALRKLPRNIVLLFVHAFQAHLLNDLLSERIAEKAFEAEEGEYFCGENDHDFPDINEKINEKEKYETKRKWLCVKMIGYETIELSEREFRIIERYCIKPSTFRIKRIPEISSKGTYRTMFAPFKDFEFDGSIFKFSIPAGSYATMALREFLEEKGSE